MTAHATTNRPRVSRFQWIALVVLLVSAVSLQLTVEGRFMPPPSIPSVVWVRSPEVMRRLTLGFNTLWADIYWIRTIQFFGDTRRSADPKKNYDLLYPLLDVTTGLDPHFYIAYRLGAILLSEGYPSGAGKPEEALALLQKGMREMPDKWQYLHDAGFVNYWWRRDYQAAAQWLLKAERMPGAPKWLAPVAASMLAEGGSSESARALWTEMAANAEHEWLRQAARRGLMQLEAEAHLEILQRAVNKFYDDNGRFPASWSEMVDAHLVRRTPVDPTGYVYAIDRVSGAVNVSQGSQLFPLRGRGTP